MKLESKMNVKYLVAVEYLKNTTKQTSKEMYSETLNSDSKRISNVTHQKMYG